MNEAPRADPIFRVYATDGKRLLVRAVDADHARAIAQARWRSFDRHAVAAPDVREAREDEVAEHFACVIALTGQRPLPGEREPIPRGEPCGGCGGTTDQHRWACPRNEARS